jgi:hypothetical protein
MEEVITDPGYYRAVTGAIRHFYVTELSGLAGLTKYTRDGILSPLRRQARNYPMQHVVAVTTARALLRFIQERRERGLQARICMLLYDAVTALTPLAEAKTASWLLKQCLTEWNPWTMHGRTFHFEVDVSTSFRWGVKPNASEKAKLNEYLK